VAYLVLEEASEGRNIKSLQTVMDVGKWIYALPTFYLHQAARVIEDLPRDKVEQVNSVFLYMPQFINPFFNVI
jgi:hypothetical protein